MIFCDTSAAAKLYMPEAESPRVRMRLEAEDRVCVSSLFRVELFSLFHRRLRSGKWDRPQFNAAVRQFQLDDGSGFFTWLPVDEDTVAAAAEVYVALPETINLSSADCLHLMTAVRAGFTDICTYDVNQSSGASALGLTAFVV